MFDMREIVKRYFKVTLPSGLELELEPPKMKVLRKLMRLAKASQSDDFTEDQLDELIEAVAIMLSKNNKKHKITAQEVEDMLDLDNMLDLVIAYFNWVEEISDSKN
ncbi:hypothetical protein E4P35_11005 [Thiopseudomonas sp. 4R-3cl]|nr:hypothetical protein E4P35_11005 [Thiopseudomonas sp. 4R-3cl]